MLFVDDISIVIVYDVSIVIVYDVSMSKPPWKENWLHGSMGKKTDIPSIAI